jgi:cyanophycin synthetase
MMDRKPDIRLLRIRYLRGPNLWTYRPVLETWLDLGELEDHPSNTLPGMNQRLCSWLPALAEHHCGVGEPGGFLQRLQEGTWCGHVLEHVVIELRNLAGMPPASGRPAAPVSAASTAWSFARAMSGSPAPPWPVDTGC